MAENLDSFNSYKGRYNDSFQEHEDSFSYKQDDKNRLDSYRSSNRIYEGYKGRYNSSYQDHDEEEYLEQELAGRKYRVVDECNNNNSNNSNSKLEKQHQSQQPAAEYKHKLKRKLREHLPDDWDLESTSSLESNLFTLNENIRTISHLITKVRMIKR